MYAFTPDDSILATAGGGLDRTVRLWDVATGRQLRVFSSTARVDEVAFSSDGKLLALQTAVQQVSVFSVDDGRVVKTFTTTAPFEANALAFSPDSRVIAVGSGSTRNGNWLKIFRIDTGEATTIASVPVQEAQFAPDGSLVWIEGASWTEGGALRVWTPATRSSRTLATLKGMPSDLAVSGDGRLVAAVYDPGPISKSTDNEVAIWNLESGTRIWRTDSHRSTKFKHVAFTHDGARLAVSSGTTTVYAAPEWTPSTTVPGRIPRFLTDGRLAVEDSGILIVNLATNGRGRIETGNAAAIHAARFTRDGRYIVAAHNSATVLWDLASGQPARTWKAGTFPGARVAVAPQSTWAVIPGELEFRIVNVPAGDLRGSIPSQEFVRAGGGPVISADERWIADGVRNGRDSRDRRLRITDAATASTVALLPLTESVGAIAFSADSRYLAAAGGAEVINIWSTADWKKIGTIDPQRRILETTALAFVGASLVVGELDGLQVYSLDGQRRQTLKGHTSFVKSIAVSPDGLLLAAGDFTNITLWDTSSWGLVATLQGHQGRVEDVTFSADGNWLLSASYDGTARLWNVRERREALALMMDQKGADWIAVTPDGLFDGSSNGWNLILWRFSQRTREVMPVEAFFNDYYHPGLLADVLHGRAPAAPRDVARRDRRLPDVSLTVDSSNASTAHIRIRASENQASPGGGVRDVRLMRNGVMVKAWRGTLAASDEFEADVPLVNGRNLLSAYAFNQDNVKSETGRATVNGKRTVKGKLYAVIAGVDHYADSTLDLRYAVADAQAFVDAMTRDIAPAMDRTAVIAFLRDDRATAANLRAALRLLGTGVPTADASPPELQNLAKATPDDVVIIFFAGHGTASNDKFFLLLHDANPRELKTGVSGDDLQALVEDIDAAALLMVTDSCQSGQLLEAADTRQGPMNTKGLAQLAYDKGMYVLAASQSYQAALEVSQLGHGLLTYSLIKEGLDDFKADADPRDGRIGPREWLEYAVKRVPELSVNPGAARTLTLVTRPTDFARAPQIPRAFFRRDSDDNALTIRKLP